MPGDIDEGCYKFQSVMNLASIMAGRLVVENGEKMAGWRADLLIRRS